MLYFILYKFPMGPFSYSCDQCIHQIERLYTSVLKCMTYISLVLSTLAIRGEDMTREGDPGSRDFMVNMKHQLLVMLVLLLLELKVCFYLLCRLNHIFILYFQFISAWPLSNIKFLNIN